MECDIVQPINIIAPIERGKVRRQQVFIADLCKRRADGAQVGDRLGIAVGVDEPEELDWEGIHEKARTRAFFLCCCCCLLCCYRC